MSTIVGCNTCSRLNDMRSSTSELARRTAASISRAGRIEGRPSTSSMMSSQWPTMAVRTLLKSWAMPPASRPRASIFRAVSSSRSSSNSSERCRSTSSACARSRSFSVRARHSDTTKTTTRINERSGISTISADWVSPARTASTTTIVATETQTTARTPNAHGPRNMADTVSTTNTMWNQKTTGPVYAASRSAASNATSSPHVGPETNVRPSPRMTGHRTLAHRPGSPEFASARAPRST